MPAKKRLLLAAKILALLLLALFGLYSCSQTRGLQNEIAQTPRHPITGIVLGAQARTLHPPNGPTTKTACLLIHGFLAAPTDFADMGERLQKAGYTVRLMRLPGHGTTPPDFAWQPPGALYRAVEAEFQALQATHQQVNVIGFSMGGALATLLASRQPVAKLALAAPYYGVTYKWYYLLPPETWSDLLPEACFPYLDRGRFAARLKDQSQAGKFFQYNHIPTRGLEQLIALGRQARQPQVLGAITCPVLILHARDDHAACPAASHRAYEKIASTSKEWIWLDRSDHMIFWDYDSEQVKAAILRFFHAPTP